MVTNYTRQHDYHSFTAPAIRIQIYLYSFWCLPCILLKNIPSTSMCHLAFTFAHNRNFQTLSSFKCNNCITNNLLIRDCAYHLLRCGIIEICIDFEFGVQERFMLWTHDKFGLLPYRFLLPSSDELY